MKGNCVGLIGPNGAGKTTLFNLLTGVYEPSEGTITLDGQLLNGKAPYKIAQVVWDGLSKISSFKRFERVGQCFDLPHNHHKPHAFASLFPIAKLLQE